MTRSVGAKVEKSFVKGLVTEATGINFPENSCTDTYNCVFDEKGRVTRRKGFKYEGNYETDSFNRAGGVTTEFYWKNAGSTGTVNLVVVQIKNMLYFYKEFTNTALSSGYLGLNINLNSYAAGGTTDIPLYNCQFATAEGKLFVAHPLCDPFYVVYDNTAPSVTGTEITVKIRDLKGDNADPYYNDSKTRPTATTATVSVHHLYNLYNQGWAANVRTVAPSTANPVTFWDSVLTTIPSNGDVWHLFKDANDLFDPVNWQDRTNIGNVLSPKGYYVLDAFNTDRDTASGLSGLTDETSNGVRPSCIATYAGRVWYGGVNAEGYSQSIYYSQIIVKQNEYGFCYQASDPTSEVSFDLLPTDGGVISISEVGTIIKLYPMQNNLLVFGTNGVWSISGSQGLGFSANDYSVTKISSTASISALSFVDVYGVPLWWNFDGIFSIQPDPVLGSHVSKSISDATIRTFVNTIHPDMKGYVKGAFNQYTKTVQWLFNTNYTTDIEEAYQYNGILNYNVLNGSFYPWTLPDSNPTINGVVVSRGPDAVTASEAVVDSTTAAVLTLGSEVVTAEVLGEGNPNLGFRYLTSKKQSASAFDFTWSQVNNTTYYDWFAPETPLDYSSYCFTNYQLDGDAQRFFQNNYIVVYLDAISNGSLFLEGWWDYVSTTASARTTNPQQVYPTLTAVSTMQKRVKIRGKGRAVQLKFYSESGKPFSLVGWSTWSTQNASV